MAGTQHAAWLYAQLPPLNIDVQAVGGAATASGGALLILAALHLAAAWLLLRSVTAATTAVVGLAAVMAALVIGWGVAAVVSALSGSGPADLLVPAGIGLGVVAVGYAGAARQVMARRHRPRPGA